MNSDNYRNTRLLEYPIMGCFCVRQLKATERHKCSNMGYTIYKLNIQRGLNHMATSSSTPKIVSSLAERITRLHRRDENRLRKLGNYIIHRSNFRKSGNDDGENYWFNMQVVFFSKWTRETGKPSFCSTGSEDYIDENSPVSKFSPSYKK